MKRGVQEKEFEELQEFRSSEGDLFLRPVSQ
jgi:hypothetical protein